MIISLKTSSNLPQSAENKFELSACSTFMVIILWPFPDYGALCESLTEFCLTQLEVEG